ncbi:hypothetical protein EJ08DRAFT_272508 [Tothia fuscella]|uniref:ARB-07466-like C-terminal domain-containing protein n=1 Tax=Tothia fuscella TaxID=1048955 RepID=A0A9P4NQ70_9PEZI|nr:hypothetical protein EJ08DRAFT_272508 [Tothia fuscella]
MQLSIALSVVALLIPQVILAHEDQPNQLVKRASLNGPCTGYGGAPGVCISTTDCTADGGRHILNACPGLPDNIRCCTKTSCGSGGNCRFTNTCASGNTISNQCPGPADFKCCLPGTSPNPGGFPAPHIPAVGACKAPAVNGAQKVVAALPGKVREIFCTRDCACPGTSEHCCGMAIDFMCTSAGGTRNAAGTANGLAIRDWVKANAASLNVLYIIWGQQIWSPARASEGWRNMADRGSITANHWYVVAPLTFLNNADLTRPKFRDHVHVSYK